MSETPPASLDRRIGGGFRAPVGCARLPGRGGGSMKEAFSWLAIGAALVSAAVGLYAALGIDVRDNMDAFICDLRKQSQWAAWAASAAGISVLAQAIEKVLK
jgi:hypothetical protein